MINFNVNSSTCAPCLEWTKMLSITWSLGDIRVFATSTPVLSVCLHVGMRAEVGEGEGSR